MKFEITQAIFFTYLIPSVLFETIKSLDVRGLIERQIDKRNRAFVRLSDKDYSSNGRLFDVHQMDC